MENAAKLLTVFPDAPTKVSGEIDGF
jgi:hypothetical protein